VVPSCRLEVLVIARILFLTAALFVAGCQSSPSPGNVSEPVTSALSYRQTGVVGDDRFAAIVVDADSGAVLHAENDGALRYPASLAKMMTLYLLFQEIESGRLSMDSALVVSPTAAAQPPSKLGLRAGSTLRVSDAVAALTVKSANDVAAVVAENLAGSEPAFADRMTRTARALGMRSTRFANASGLPDPAQVTTARDMAILCRALRNDFPRQASSFSRRSFSYAGKTYESTNKLLGAVEGMDFGKTGYTRASGFNLATSVKRGGDRIIVVVMGESSSAARNQQVASLVDQYLPEQSYRLSYR
jgi:D-alanyl-D-alanine carboxypeptidase